MRPAGCRHWTPAGGYCGAPGPTRYLNTWACLPHAPAALRGATVPVPDPGLTVDGRRAAANAVYSHLAGPTAIDQRAIASGRRRSTPTDYRAARDAVNARKAQDRELRR